MAFIIGAGFPVLAASSAAGNLVTSGRAEVKAEPDMARFTVGVETRAETVEEARAQNARRMNDMRTALLEAGADERLIRTRNFNVNPEWRHNPSDGSRTLIGYVVSHTLEVTVTDLERLGDWLDVALQKGATNVGGPTFGLSNQDELEARALTEAIRRARAKADVMAQAAGVFLKRVVHISEHVNAPFGGAMESIAFARIAADAAPATSISPGEISIVATVNMTFEI